MTADNFRGIALSFPEAEESSHMAHPDFRVGGKIFATLGYPDTNHGAVMLTPEEQTNLLRQRPDVFSPAKGAWGEHGATQVRLEICPVDVLRAALAVAWQKVAPKRLARQHSDI